MTPEMLVLLCAGTLCVALLYSAVGHAGASGYIAVMSLVGLAPDAIRPTALTLNILVGSIATFQFWRAGHFSWRLFWPFATLSIPLAFLGGYVSLPTRAFKIVLGLVLLASAAHLVFRPSEDEPKGEPSLPVALSIGGGLGLLAGLTGTGGGIFLTPLLLLKRWARARRAGAVSALFILVNSIAGLAGNLSSTRNIPSFIAPLVLAAGVGGVVGSYMGSRRLPHVAIKRLLAAVLVIAGTKMLLTR